MATADSMDTTSDRSHQLLAIERMSSQRQARNHDEDWTGITDWRKRKQLQNRLNQRTYRQKKKQALAAAIAAAAETQFAASASATPGNPSTQWENQTIGDWDVATCAWEPTTTTTNTAGPAESPKPSSALTLTLRPSQSPSSAGVPHSHGLLHQRDCDGADDLLGTSLYPHTSQRRLALAFVHRARLAHSSGLPSPRHLPLLIKVNLMTALTRNAVLLGIDPSTLSSEDTISPFFSCGALLSSSSASPPSHHASFRRSAPSHKLLLPPRDGGDSCSFHNLLRPTLAAGIAAHTPLGTMSLDVVYRTRGDWTREDAGVLSGGADITGRRTSSSPFASMSSPPPPPWPEPLRPTLAQHATEHHPWIDLLPFAPLRDRVLEEVEAGRLDEDELCADLMSHPRAFVGAEEGGGDEAGDCLGRDGGDWCGGGAHEMELRGGRGEQAGEPQREEELANLIVWGDASDPDAWEATLPFLTKYWSLVSGCEDLLRATNRWRERRGEKLIRWK